MANLLCQLWTLSSLEEHYLIPLSEVTCHCPLLPAFFFVSGGAGALLLILYPIFLLCSRSTLPRSSFSTERTPLLRVLGLARTGLTFTRSQEGTQLGGLSQTGQTEQGIWYHAGFRWGSWQAGGGFSSGRSGHAGHQVVGDAVCILLFVLCILRTSIVVVTVFFICCSVKLPLSWPTSFAFFFPFSSPPQGGEGQHGPFVASHGQTSTLQKLQGTVWTVLIRWVSKPAKMGTSSSILLQ